MILVIDAGNTRIKWALRAGGGWVDRDPARDAIATGNAMALGKRSAAWRDVEAVHACCVAGPVVEAAIAAALGPLARKLSWCRSGVRVQAGVGNGYANPGQLGADRWAAMIGAWGLVAGSTARDCLVVNCGTATTIDVLRRRDDGRPGAEFVGGVILPGLSMMRTALARNTAQLPLASGVYLELPRQTDDAIETGCIEAQVGAVLRLSRRLRPESVCVLSGGAAGALAGHLTLPVECVENLVLEGLARIAEENSVLP